MLLETEEDIILRVPIQFRAGEVLRDHIADSAAELEITVQEWIEQAISHRLYEDVDGPAAFCASELFNRRKPIMLRLDPLVLEIIDEQVDEDDGMTRTIWLIDTCQLFLAAE